MTKEERDRIIAVMQSGEVHELLCNEIETLAMSWHPRPSGTFDTEMANLRSKRLLTKLTAVLIKE